MNFEQQLMVMECEFGFKTVWKKPFGGTMWVAVESEGLYLVGPIDKPIELWDLFETRYEAGAILLQLGDKKKAS